MVMLLVGESGLSVSEDPDWDPLGACGSPGSPMCGPRVPRGVAESSHVQWFSVRPPLAVVSGEGGGTVATQALVSG